MLAAARGVMSMAEAIIEEELENNPDYSLVLVGHSLGGSVAALVGQMWADTFRGVRVYAYGPACVAPMDDVNRNLVVSVLLEGDPFSSLSLGHVADTSFAVAHLCEEEDLRTKILTVTDAPFATLEKEDLKWCTEQMEGMRSQMTGVKLYPPGRLLFLGESKVKKGATVIREVPSSFYGELRISPRMFDLRRHVPRVYQRRLRSARRSIEKPDSAR
jgi:pimeloyl-ACP methyl ester carboxylesterase